MTIIALSDVHLGFDRSNSRDFLEFLKQLQNRDDLDDFVIVGDFIDLWRRDVIGLEFELSKYIEELKILQKNANIHYVIGNHDFHLRSLKNHEYPFEFKDSLLLERFGYKIKFLHGFQCDPIQNLLGPDTSEILCWTLSDDAGEMKSRLWDILSPKLDISKEDLEKKLELLKNPPEDPGRRMEFSKIGRVSDFIDCLKAKFKITDEEEFIVYGHTHKPFIDTESRVANTGCWIKDSEYTNTYFEFKDWPPHIFEFKGQEIKSTAIESLEF